MSRTLNLIELLLNSGRHLRDLGRTAEAIDILSRLADFRKMPADVIEEIQALLADLHLRQENYSKARRHLTAAMAFRPLKAEYHHQMALAIEEDEHADRKRAAMYFERAVELDADNAEYWLDYGSYLCRGGKIRAGVKALRKAFSLGIADPEVVGQVAEVLRSVDRFREAATKLRTALFRNRGNERFVRLWREHQFLTLSAQQRRLRKAAPDGKKGPVILPFTPAEQTGKYVELGEKTIRIDQAEPIGKPRSPLPLPFRRPPKG
jgi:tetratricopeptide (TPR) repeat protein